MPSILNPGLVPSGLALLKLIHQRVLNREGSNDAGVIWPVAKRNFDVTDCGRDRGLSRGAAQAVAAEYSSQGNDDSAANIGEQRIAADDLDPAGEGCVGDARDFRAKIIDGLSRHSCYQRLSPLDFGVRRQPALHYGVADTLDAVTDGSVNLYGSIAHDLDEELQHTEHRHERIAMLYAAALHDLPELDQQPLALRFRGVWRA